MSTKIKLVVFGEALTYPPKEGISAHVFGLLSSLTKSDVIQPMLVVADRGYVQTAQYNRFPWQTYLVPPQDFYDYTKMRRLLAKIGPDIIQSYDMYQARLIGTRYSEEFGVPLVMEHHDLESDRASFLELPGDIGNKNANAQHEIASFAALNRVMSRPDYNILKKSTTNNQTSFIYLPVATDDDFTDGLDTSRRNNHEILFIGNGAYPPNYAAMHHILDILAPSLLDYTFHIVGRLSDQLIPKNSPNIFGYGMIDDLRPLVERCFCGIAPIEAGSGMKIKILTYSSACLPVVATPVALQGFPNAPYYIPANYSEMKEKIVALSNNLRLKELSIAARRHYLEYYSPDIQRPPLEMYYSEAVKHGVSKDIRLEHIDRDDSRLFWLHENRNEQLETTNIVKYFTGVNT